jgi:hypothetical protein
MHYTRERNLKRLIYILAIYSEIPLSYCPRVYPLRQIRAGKAAGPVLRFSATLLVSGASNKC